MSGVLQYDVGVPQELHESSNMVVMNMEENPKHGFLKFCYSRWPASLVSG